MESVSYMRKIWLESNSDSNKFLLDKSEAVKGAIDKYSVYLWETSLSNDLNEYDAA